MLVYERIEHPELEILDIRPFKVGSRELACYTAPTLLGIVELAVIVHVGIEVVRTAFIGIVCDIEQGECRRLAVG